MTKQIPIQEGLFTWPSDNPALLGSRCQQCGIADFPVKTNCM
ncbi:MAG: putative OB-fold protein, partial [Porticoccus sp.]